MTPIRECDWTSLRLQGCAGSHSGARCRDHNAESDGQFDRPPLLLLYRRCSLAPDGFETHLVSSASTKIGCNLIWTPSNALYAIRGIERWSFDSVSHLIGVDVRAEVLGHYRSGSDLHVSDHLMRWTLSECRLNMELIELFGSPTDPISQLAA